MHVKFPAHFHQHVHHIQRQLGIDQLTEQDLKELLTFANAGASIITTRRGALRVMPAEEEIRRLVAQRM